MGTITERNKQLEEAAQATAPPSGEQKFVAQETDAQRESRLLDQVTKGKLSNEDFQWLQRRLK